MRLHNLHRFSDIGRIAAFLKAKIPSEVELEDMDTHNPESRTSAVWRVTFKLAGCLTFLHGVVRILWFGTTIVVKHPTVGHPLQCLQCGNRGHPLARCSFTDDQPKGPGGIVVTGDDIQGLADLARPFSSIEEMKAMAAKRLQLHQEVEAAAQVAVTPAGFNSTSCSSTEPAPLRSTATCSAPQTEQGAKFAHLQPQPEPPTKQPWLTQRVKGGRPRRTYPRWVYRPPNSQGGCLPGTN